MTETRPSAWAIGYAMFAAIMLMVAGVLQFIAGLAGVIEDEFYLVTPDWIFQFDATAWGWIHIVIGIVLVLSGIGIFSGNVLARTVGVLIASLSLIANFLWLPYYPLWSIVVMFLDVAVIWALTVHGRDIAEG